MGTSFVVANPSENIVFKTRVLPLYFGIPYNINFHAHPTQTLISSLW